MKSGLYVLLSAAKEMTNIPEAHSHRSVMICKDLLAERYLKLIVSLPSPPQTTVSLCPQFKGSISILVSGTVHTAAGSIAVGCHDTMLSRYRCRDQSKSARVFCSTAPLLTNEFIRSRKFGYKMTQWSISGAGSV